MNETAPKRNIPLCDIVGNGLCAVPNCVFKDNFREWHIGHSLHKHFETTPGYPTEAAAPVGVMFKIYSSGSAGCSWGSMVGSPALFTRFFFFQSL